jgi:hypothetical protein
LTPVSKAWSTDLGIELTSLAVQIHGGMGYVEETGVAQHFRDSRIAPIYEGTNGIQAIDLVIRKLPMGDGGVVRDFFASIDGLGPELAGAGLAPIGESLAGGLGALRQATDWMLERVATNPNDALAGATAYLRMFGLVTGGWMLARSALAAHRLLVEGSGDKAFLAEKIATAGFYAGRLLPQAAGLLAAATAGAGALFDVDLTSAVPG